MAVKSEAQFIVLLGGIFDQVAFTEFSGGESQRAVERYPLGTENRMESITGIEEITDITLRKPYDPAVDDALYDKYKTYCGEAIDISVTPIKICPETEADGKTETFIGCKPVYCKRPDVNRGGSAPGMFEMRFAVSQSRLS